MIIVLKQNYSKQSAKASEQESGDEMQSARLLYCPGCEEKDSSQLWTCPYKQTLKESECCQIDNIHQSR